MPSSCPPELAAAASQAPATRRTALTGVAGALAVVATGALLDGAAAEPGYGGGSDPNKVNPKSAKKLKKKKKKLKSKAKLATTQTPTATATATPPTVPTPEATAEVVPSQTPTADPTPSSATPTATATPSESGTPTPTQSATSAPTSSTTPTGPVDGPTSPSTPSSSPSTPPPRPPFSLIPDDHTRQVLSRLTYGMTPAFLAEVWSQGGADAWLESQFSPDSVWDASADELLGWFPSLVVDPITQYQRDGQGIQLGHETMADLVRWTMLRRVRSRRQLHERMVEFWSNALHIPTLSSNAFGFRFDYDRVIRKHALGRFEDLLREAIVHPAMSVQLDNAVSTKRAVNENLGRELLELHTLGRGNFTETDVLNSARILTGYRVDVWNTWVAKYDPASHWTGPVKVGSFTHANSDPDGRAVVWDYLSYLARQPATARRIATKMARFFVSDSPPESLVSRLTLAYLANGTAIAPMLRVLAHSPEFDQSLRAKVTHPANDIVKTFRVLGIQFTQNDAEDSCMNTIGWMALGAGLVPLNWSRPDGDPLDGSAYSSVGRVLGSFEQHAKLAHGWWPRAGTTFRSSASWLPSPTVRLDELIRHLHRQVLFVEASPDIVTQCALAVRLSVDSVVSASDTSFMENTLPRLLLLLLNSPLHMNY